MDPEVIEYSVNKNVHSEVNYPNGSTLSSSYVSCIKICGKPIPPPIMTSCRRREMQELKRRAMLVEKEISERRTQQTLSKVQEILSKLDIFRDEKAEENIFSGDTAQEKILQTDLISFEEDSDEEGEIITANNENACDEVTSVHAGAIKGSVCDENVLINQVSDVHLQQDLLNDSDFSPYQPPEDNGFNKTDSTTLLNSTAPDMLKEQSVFFNKNSAIPIRPFSHSAGNKEESTNITNFCSPIQNWRHVFPTILDGQHKAVCSCKISQQTTEVNGNVSERNSLVTDTSTLGTNSTDLRPYMRVPDESFSNFEISASSTHKDFSCQTPDHPTNNPSLYETHELIQLNLNYSNSSASSTVASSPTVREAVHSTEDEQTPRLVRRGSYTLETPSPALLLSKKAVEGKPKDSDSTSSKVLCDLSVINSAEGSGVGVKNQKPKLNQNFENRTVFSGNKTHTIESLKKDRIDNEVFVQKQRHLQRYLAQASQGDAALLHQERDFSLFPGVEEDDTTRKRSNNRPINGVFPKISVSPNEIEDENGNEKCQTDVDLHSINGGSDKDSSEQQDTHLFYDESLKSISDRSSVSIQEKLIEHEKLFKEHCEVLQKQQKLQLEALMKKQWDEQILLREKFVSRLLAEQEDVAPQGYVTDLSPGRLIHSPTDESTEDFVLNKVSPSVPNENSVSSNQVPKTLNSMSVTPEIRKRFERLPALIKGHLVRKLMKTEQVQTQIQTIKDTLRFALKFQSETPIKNHQVSVQDVALHRRLISQVTVACHQLHNLFFKLPKSEQMKIIVKSEKVKSKSASKPQSVSPNGRERLSSATLKYRARKQEYSQAFKFNSLPRRNLNTRKDFQTRPGNILSRKGSESARRKLYGAVNIENTKLFQGNIAQNAMPAKTHWK